MPRETPRTDALGGTRPLPKTVAIAAYLQFSFRLYQHHGGDGEFPEDVLFGECKLFLVGCPVGRAVGRGRGFSDGEARPPGGRRRT